VKLYIYDATWDTKITVQVTISTTLIVSSCCLIINAYFEKEMKEEARRIKIVSIIFPITYFTRAIAYYMLPTARLNCVFLSVDSDGETIGAFTSDKDTAIATCFALYLFWDILPLSLVMFNHYKAYSDQEKHLKDRTA